MSIIYNVYLHSHMFEDSTPKQDAQQGDSWQMERPCPWIPMAPSSGCRGFRRRDSPVSPCSGCPPTSPLDDPCKVYDIFKELSKAFFLCP